MKSLVFIDVDGVINAFEKTQALLSKRKGGFGAAIAELDSGIDIVVDGHQMRMINGFVVCVSQALIPGLKKLTEVAEVVWLTTWRCRANEIGEWLGLPELDCVDDGSGRRIVDWKWEFAEPIAEAAMAEGRNVWWIEDFGWDPQFTLASMAGVHCLDTVQTAYELQADDLDELLTKL